MNLPKFFNHFQILRKGKYNELIKVEQVPLQKSEKRKI